ncbi:MAG TPA: radical SAM protein [Candidatus Eisenbacteria bacterium]|nr:radical SAM protein [Candidatus Eisenbacteria bacterium]
MTLTGLHLLLTYGCTYECDHCFVWSSPEQPGTITIPQVDEILRQTRALGTVEWFYFEGGEPFLYHGLLRWSALRARKLGFRVGIVSNAYWATSEEDATEWLRDLSGVVDDLSLSCDAFHGGADQERRVDRARRAALRLGMPVDTIQVAPVEDSAAGRVGQLPAGESAVMFRGRAAAVLAPHAPHVPWASFDRCPHEDLREPGRVHVDPLGWVHVCQGIAIGNLFRTPLVEIVARYDPEAHPITGPLLAGGPAELARRHGVGHGEAYADACHLCDRTRAALRVRFPEELGPAQMYGPVR